MLIYYDIEVINLKWCSDQCQYCHKLKDEKYFCMLFNEFLKFDGNILREEQCVLGDHKE